LRKDYRLTSQQLPIRVSIDLTSCRLCQMASGAFDGAWSSCIGRVSIGGGRDAKQHGEAAEQTPSTSSFSGTCDTPGTYCTIAVRPVGAAGPPPRVCSKPNLLIVKTYDCVLLAPNSVPASIPASVFKL